MRFPPGQTALVERSVMNIRRCLISASRAFHHARTGTPVNHNVIRYCYRPEILERFGRKPLGAVPMTFLWVYSSGMGTIHHPDQPELPIVQQITCRRCRGVGEVYYARIRADVVGGKRIRCPECGGVGKLDLAEQLFRYDVASQYKKSRGKRSKSSVCA